MVVKRDRGEVKSPSPCRAERSASQVEAGRGVGGEGLLPLRRDFLLWRNLLSCSFAIRLRRFYQRSNLLMHVKLNVVITTAVFAGCAGTFPTTEWLETGPSTGRRALWTIRIRHACFDLIEEPVHFFGRTIEACGETVVDIIGDLHRFIEIMDLANRRDRQEHLILPQAMIVGQVGHKSWFAVIAFIVDAASLYMTTGQELASRAVDLFGKVLEVIVGTLINHGSPVGIAFCRIADDQRFGLCFEFGK